MDTIKFWGSSDDLVEIEAVGNTNPKIEGLDEYNCMVNQEIVQGVFTVNNVLKVYAIYDGCWSFAASQINEDNPISELWQIETLQCAYNDYSTELIITSPYINRIVRIH